MSKKITLVLFLCMLISMTLVGCGETANIKNSENKEISQKVDETIESSEITVLDEIKNENDIETNAQDEQVDPMEWQDTEIDGNSKKICTLEIICDSILSHKEDFNEDKLLVLPDDGIIYEEKEVEFYEGESVFNILLRETKQNKIQFEFSMAPFYNSYYIEGINNIYEFDCGELSGWMYKVNGWFPNYGVSKYKLKDGDKVVITYTCDLGRDVGGDFYDQTPSQEDKDDQDKDD